MKDVESKVIYVQADLSNPKVAADNLVDATIAAFNRIDILGLRFLYFFTNIVTMIY